MKNIVDKIDNYINEGKLLNDLDEDVMSNEYSNISSGLKKLQIRLSKANTPKKYTEAFELIQDLVNKFPLKAKIIWQIVASEYQTRFGAISEPTETE